MAAAGIELGVDLDPLSGRDPALDLHDPVLPLGIGGSVGEDRPDRVGIGLDRRIGAVLHPGLLGR
jgi:hypothetical protein